MEAFRVRAVNTAPDSENRMHEDSTAGRYGFRGGLVPGVTVYGYMSEALGADYLRSGGMSLRLLKPFYEGDEVCVHLEDGEVSARDASGEVHAVGRLRRTRAPEPAGEAPLPLDRPAADAATLAPGTRLGTLHTALETPGAEALLQLSNFVLMQNVRLDPWIHAASEIQHFSRAEPNEPLSVRARVADRFEKKGHEFVVLDVAVLGADTRWVQHVVHTAIYKYRGA